MPLTPEMRARMAQDMQSNRKFDGETDIPPECRGFIHLADVETVERPAVDGWRYRVYVFRPKKGMEPNAPLHINIHGGGFVIGHMPNDTLWCAWLADQIGGVVVDVDYTTTEYAPHPVALDQCRDAARFAYAHCKEWGCDEKRISMGGYSAGGTYTIACAMAALKNHECPYCLLVDGYGPGDMRYDEKVRDIPEFWKTQEYRSVGFSVLYSDDDATVMNDPLIYPLGASDDDLRGLPPTLILAAAACPFRFQNEELGKRLAALGTEVTMKRFPDTAHGFIPHFMPHWKEAGDLIVRAIRNTSL